MVKPCCKLLPYRNALQLAFTHDVRGTMTAFEEQFVFGFKDETHAGLCCFTGFPSFPRGFRQ